MSGQTLPPRTRFTRVPCDAPGVTIFQIAGSLGPRAKPQLVRLTQECLRRNLPRLVFDLSEVDALGGGTARLLNEFAAERAGRGGRTAFRVTSRTVRGFLCADPHLLPPPLVASIDEAIAAVVEGNESGRGRPAPAPRVVSVRRSNAPDGAFTSRKGRAESEPSAAPRRPAPMETSRAAEPPRPPESTRVAEPSRRNPPPRPAEPSPRRNTAAPERFGRELFLPEEEEPEAMKPPARRNGGAARAEESSRTTTAAQQLRERLQRALRDRGVASRLFFFERDSDGRFYLVTRHGADRERAFEGAGALAATLFASRVPTFLIDIDPDAVSEAEIELLSELNCEIAVPVGNGTPPPYAVFLSKENPGDEYSLEELQELDEILRATTPRPSLMDDDVEEPQRAPLMAPAVDAELRSLFGDDGGELPPEPSGSLPDSADDFLMHEPNRPAPIRVVDHAPGAPPRGASPDQVRVLRRSVAQMRDILSLTHDFDAAFGTSKLLEVLVLSVVSVGRVETVLFFAQQDGNYVLTHHRGLSHDAVAGLRLRTDSTLVQRAIASGSGVEIADSAQITEEERIWARQHGLQFAVPFRYEDEILGVLILGASADEAPPDLEMLGWLLGQAALAYDRARLYETLQDRTLGVVRGLITLIESRNAFDCGSTEQVVRYAQALARELQFPQEQLRDLIYGAVLRDVGMLKISEALLRSSSDLTADQWETIRQHPQEGASIMRQMRFGPVAVDVVLHHHETYNGEGYPMGLRGRAIPLGARIVAVAESYVKMTMDRPYRKALGKPEALESLAENWGLRYDPLVVDALVRVVNRELSLGLKTDRDLTKDLFGV